MASSRSFVEIDERILLGPDSTNPMPDHEPKSLEEAHAPELVRLLNYADATKAEVHDSEGDLASGFGWTSGHRESRCRELGHR